MLGASQHQLDREGFAALGSASRPLGLLTALASKCWLGVVEGHEIRVVTRGFFAARLYIDGEQRDKRSPLLSRHRNVPLLTGRLPNMRSEVTLVYVYPRGLCPVQFEVRVAGKLVPMNRCVDEPVE